MKIFTQNLAVAKPKLIWLSTPLLWFIFAYYRVIKKWLSRPPRLDIYNFFYFTQRAWDRKKNTNEQRVNTDYMQDISKFCRLWLSKTYAAKVINSH
jgi:hypothetical protein